MSSGFHGELLTEQFGAQGASSASCAKTSTPTSLLRLLQPSDSPKRRGCAPLAVSVLPPLSSVVGCRVGSAPNEQVRVQPHQSPAQKRRVPSADQPVRLPPVR